MKFGPVLVALLMVTAAGCVSDGTPDNTSVTTSLEESEIDSPDKTTDGGSLTNEESTTEDMNMIKQEVIDREKERVQRLLENSSEYSDISIEYNSVADANVTSRNSTGVFVQVTIPVSYQYSCEDSNRGGFVDGDTIETVYFVSSGDYVVNRVLDGAVCS